MVGVLYTFTVYIRLPFTSSFVPLKCFEKDSFLWDQGEKCPEEMQHNDIYIRGLSIPKHLDTFFFANLKTLKKHLCST